MMYKCICEQILDFVYLVQKCNLTDELGEEGKLFDEIMFTLKLERNETCIVHIIELLENFL